MTITDTSKIDRWKVPTYFGGTGGTHCRVDRAIAALVALTGRGMDDPAVRLIVNDLDDAHCDLMSESVEYGSILGGIPGLVEEHGAGMDNWPDDVYKELTGSATAYHSLTA